MKRSKLSKLELWLNDNSYVSPIGYSNRRSSRSGPDDKDNDQAQIIYGLLEDSLSPLKFSLSSKCGIKYIFNSLFSC